MSVRIGESWPAGHGRRRWASVSLPWPLLIAAAVWYSLFWLFAAMLWLPAEACLLAVSVVLVAVDLIAGRRGRVTVARVGLGLFALTLKARP